MLVREMVEDVFNIRFVFTTKMAASRPSFFSIHIVEARMRVNTQCTARGGMRQEGQEREGQNSGEQRHKVICGRERD